MTDLEKIETTDSGHVPKRKAMKWLESLDHPEGDDLRDSIVPKPAEFSGSTYPTDISTIRFTGDAEFIETIAGVLKPLLAFEDQATRVELNLQRTEDRDTGELTENYALYFNVTERPE
jgi:hypothetical protein